LFITTCIEKQCTRPLKNDTPQKKIEAGELDTTDFTPDSLTRLSWRRGHLDAGYVFAWGTSWCQNVVLHKNLFLQLH